MNDEMNITPDINTEDLGVINDAIATVEEINVVDGEPIYHANEGEGE